jgi:NTE family protein
VSRKIGLALGGGGARGWAHVGVLRALEEEGIPIHCVAGTSIGALVGGVYARDKLHALEELANDFGIGNLLSLIDMSFPGLGLVHGQRVRDLLSKYLLDAKIEDCTIPFRCVATDFLLKEEVVFKSGSMVEAVRASMAVPGLFVPSQHGDAYLVDGGVINPVTVNVVKAMGADVVIAVNLNRVPKTRKLSIELAKSVSSKPKIDVQKNYVYLPKHETQETVHYPKRRKGWIEKIISGYQKVKGKLRAKFAARREDLETEINIFDIIDHSVAIMEQEVTHIHTQVKFPYVLIEPELMDYGMLDFLRAKSMIKLGYETARTKLSEIRNLINGS